MDVAVIIPVYNGARWIAETLESVLGQSHPPEDIVVVDDGSIDESPDIVAGYDGVRLLSNPGKGPNAARNFGFSETTSRLVAFVDHDDLWHESHLLHLTGLLDENPDAVAAFSTKTTFHHEEHPVFSVSSCVPQVQDPWNSFPANVLGVPAGALIRRKALQRVGGWSTAFDGCADYHLWLKLALVGPLVRSTCATAAYRINAGSYADRLRGQDALRYFQLLVRASYDALLLRKDYGQSTENLERIHSAHVSLAIHFQAIIQQDRELEMKAIDSFAQYAESCSWSSLFLLLDNYKWHAEKYINYNLNVSFLKFIVSLGSRIPKGYTRSKSFINQYVANRVKIEEVLKNEPLSAHLWMALGRKMKKKIRNIRSVGMQ